MRKFVLLSFLMFAACKTDVKFDSEQWNDKAVDWQITDTREKMVADLIKSDTLIGLEKEQIFHLIGKPEFENGNNLSYLVREKYSWNLDPDQILYLVVKVDENGIATQCYLQNTK